MKFDGLPVQQDDWTRIPRRLGVRLWIQIRDARTGKVLDQEAANFAGSEEGWGSGVRMLIRHQILPAKD